MHPIRLWTALTVDTAFPPSFYLNNDSAEDHVDTVYISKAALDTVFVDLALYLRHTAALLVCQPLHTVFTVQYQDIFFKGLLPRSVWC